MESTYLANVLYGVASTVSIFGIAYMSNEHRRDIRYVKFPVFEATIIATLGTIIGVGAEIIGRLHSNPEISPDNIATTALGATITTLAGMYIARRGR